MTRLGRGIYHFCPQSVEQDSISWSHLILGKARKCHLAVCPGGKWNGLPYISRTVSVYNLILYLPPNQGFLPSSHGHSDHPASTLYDLGPFGYITLSLSVRSILPRVRYQVGSFLFSQN